MKVLEIGKAVIFGILEGLTEFLPVSSTGHLILAEKFLPFQQPDWFFQVFKSGIQIGAMLSVILVYWYKLWPFGREISAKQKRGVFRLWIKIIIACIPAAIVGFLLEDTVDARFSTPQIIAASLIVYGIAFIVVEQNSRKLTVTAKTTGQITLQQAFWIGLFQTLSIIPGTSRSGATILGALLLGIGRPAAAEFSFFLGIPVVCGAGFLKILKNGLSFDALQWVLLAVGTAAAFFTAYFTVQTLISFVKKNKFTVFGWYRIALGILVLIVFGFHS